MTSRGRIAGTVFFGQFNQNVGSFHDDAAARVLGGELTELAKELGVVKGLRKRSIVVDRIGRELDDRARLDVAPRSDMVSEAGSGRTECVASVVVVGIDDDDWLCCACVDNELSNASLLFAGQRQLRVGFGPNGTIDVVPTIHHAHFDQTVDPFIGNKVVNVGFANAGADADEQFVLDCVLDTLHRLVQHAVSTTTGIADDFGTFDTDERSDIAEATKFLGDFVGDEVSVGEDLKIDVAIGFEDFQQIAVHEGFATENPKEAIPHRFGLGDGFVRCFQFDAVLFRTNVDPTSLASQITAIDDRKVEERREELAFLEPSFVFVNAQKAANAERPASFQEEAFIGFD